MRKYSALPAALAGALLTSPALAAPDLTAAAWVDDECMDAFRFYDGGAFHEMDVAGDFFGTWRLDGDTLILQYEDGNVMQTVISSDVFVLNFKTRDGDYVCEFRPE